MTQDELFSLIAKLKEAGVTQFKHDGLELTLAPAPPAPPVSNAVPMSLEIPPGEPETQPPHIVQQMKSLLKLSDDELIDQLFPLPAEEMN